MYPYDDDEVGQIPNPGDALKKFVDDPLYWREQDLEFRHYVDQGFKTVFGGEAAEQDATGRTVTPEARAVSLPPFRPRVEPGDLELNGGVGENQPNRWRDVYTVQKGLAATSHYPLDLAKEKSGEYSPALAQSIRDFQREKKEEVDGLLLPSGPTITRIKEGLSGRHAAMPAKSAAVIAQTAAARPDSWTDILRPITPPLSSQSRMPTPPAASDNGGTNPAILLAQAENPQRDIPAPPSPPSDKAKWFTLPTEQRTDDPNDWGTRAVIVRMSDGRNYILREPTPREMRVKNKSDFQTSPGTAAHRLPLDMAKARFSWAVPMTEAEAEEARERTERRRNRSGDEPYQARIPIRSNGGNGVYIRYYMPDGKHEDHVALDGKTGERLFAAGDEPVYIAAHDALELGLIDWMPIKPPEHSRAAPVAPRNWKNRDWRNRIGRFGYFTNLGDFADDQREHGGRAEFFALPPRNAARTWR
jgi:hypothetical protein